MRPCKRPASKSGGTPRTYGRARTGKQIRQAITNDALVFLACFSSRSLAKDKSYQNEELLLAIEELRQRRPDEPWLIPIRLDDCEVPDRDLGGGRTLSSLQRVDLFGNRADQGVARLVATVLRLLGSNGDTTDLPLSVSRTDQVKAMLALPERDIALDDLVMAEANRCADALDDPTRFPTSSAALSGDGTRFLADQAHRYLEITLPLAELLITGCALGSARHNPLWRRAVEVVGGTVTSQRGGAEVLLDLRHLALLPLLFGGGLGAVARQNWPALLAISTEAERRNSQDEKATAVSFGHVWLPFGSAETAASVFAIEVAEGGPLAEDQINALRTRARGRRISPVSDVLHDRLRPLLRPLIRDDRDFDDAFDELEVLLAVLAAASAAEAHARGRYQHGPWFGAFTWRRRYDRDFEQRIWSARRDPLLAAGAFGGDQDKAEAAFAVFAEGSSSARRNRY